MNILDLVSAYLESIGYERGPAYHPGCFFFVKSRDQKVKICLERKDGLLLDIMLTKEPTVLLIYRGWADDMKSILIDLVDPNSLEEIGKIVRE